VRLLISLELIFQIRLRFPLVGFGLVLISVVYAIVIFRFKILGPMPLARQVILEQIPIGMVVLDDQKRIYSLNRVAEHMLKVTHKNLKGRPIQDVLDAYPKSALPDNCDHHFEFKLEDGDKVIDYLLDILPLKDWRGLHVGQLLLLTDVTDQRQAQAQILEQGRVLATLQERDLLARELHDDLAQVLAFIHTQGQTVQRLISRGDLATADQYMQQLIEATRGGEVDLRESIYAMRMTLSEHGLIGTLQKQLDQFERSHAIHTELIGSEAFNEIVLAPMVEIQLLRILGEAFTNIRKHAQADQVRVEFDVINHSVCVTVKDNGLGFDPAESAVDREKHFGLQMMRERTAAIGGTIHMNSQPGSGTEIRLCVPGDGKTVLK